MWPKSPKRSAIGAPGYSERIRLYSRIASSGGKRSSAKPFEISIGAGGSEWSM